MEQREAKTTVVVGEQGVGKTYTTIQQVKQYVTGYGGRSRPRKVIIFDVNDEYTDFKSIALDHIEWFCAHPNVEIRRIRPFNHNGDEMSLSEMADTLYLIAKTFRGGLLLVEDINKYLTDSMPGDIIGQLCTKRHRDMDLFIHYQSIGRITPKIWQNLNAIRFHRNSDNVDKHKNKFTDKYEIFKIVENIVNYRCDVLGDKRFYVLVNTDTKRITGTFTNVEFTRAVLEYLAEKMVSKMRQKKGIMMIKYGKGGALKSVDELRDLVTKEEVQRLMSAHSNFKNVSEAQVKMLIKESSKLL